MTPHTEHRAAGSVILAGILWGCIGIFIRQLSAGGLDALQISCIRSVLTAAILTAAVLLKSPGKLKVRLRDLWMFAGTGIVSVVFFNVCYFDTMIHSEASLAVVLLYTSPVFVMLLSALIYRERITKRRILALIFTVVGCAAAAGLSFTGLRIPLRVLLTGLGSGLFYALYTIFGRAALRRYDTVTVTVYTFLFAAAGSLPAGKLPQTAAAISAKPSLLLWAAGISLCCTALPYFFYTWGLRRLDSGKAAILVAVEPLVGAVIGMTAFHETKSIGKLIGICLILSAIVLLNTEHIRPGKIKE